MMFSATELASEEWRTIRNHVGYEVSNLGRVRSWYRRGRHARKGLWSTPHVLGGKPGKNGYPAVGLAGKRVYVHALVLEAFVGPRPRGMVARHVDDREPSDVRLSNLAWGTYSQNMLDRRRHGTAHNNSRLTDEQRAAIRASTESGVALAERYSIVPSAISTIRGPMSPKRRSQAVRDGWKTRRKAS